MPLILPELSPNLLRHHDDPALMEAAFADTSTPHHSSLVQAGLVTRFQRFHARLGSEESQRNAFWELLALYYEVEDRLAAE